MRIEIRSFFRISVRKNSSDFYVLFDFSMLSISDLNLTFSKHSSFLPAGRFAFTKLTGQKHKAGRSRLEASGFAPVRGLFSLFLLIHQDVTRLAVKRATDGLQRLKAHGLRASRLTPPSATKPSSKTTRRSRMERIAFSTIGSSCCYHQKFGGVDTHSTVAGVLPGLAR